MKNIEKNVLLLCNIASKRICTFYYTDPNAILRFFNPAPPSPIMYSDQFTGHPETGRLPDYELIAEKKKKS